MKRRFTILTAALALLAILAIPMGMWGQTTADVTLSSGTFNNNVITWTCADGNITIQQLKGSGSTNPSSSYISAPRVYKQNILSFVGTNGYTITNIDIKCNGAYYGTTKYAGTEISNDNVENNTIALNPTWSTTNGGTHTIATVSSDGLSEIYIQNGHSSDVNTQLRITQLTITYKVSGNVTATTVTINASGLTNTDVYTSTTAGSLSATVKENTNNTVISGATVTWTSSNTDVATIDNNGAVTLVAVGTTTITASYAGGNGYGSSSATHELTVTSSEPYVQPTTIEITPNYEFWGKIGQFSGDTYSELEGSKDNVTLNWTKGSGSTYANSTAMRFYKDNELTFTAPEGYEITSIVITFSSTQYSPSDLSFTPGNYSLSETTGTWTGSSSTVTMSRPSNASSYAQISYFTITLGIPSTDPTITANDVNVAYDATSGEIEYTITNPATNGNLTVSENVDWISNATVNTSESKVTFTTTANEATTAREGVITLTYTYGDNETVTKDVTVTQAAAPVIYTTIPALFEAATSTETSVLVTFNNWVVSGVSTNGKNVFVTDNNGNGFVIYSNEDMSSIYAAGSILSGTAVSCSLKKYNGFAELLNVNATDLTIATGGNVTEANVAMADLAGVNTGALVHYENLTCSVNNNKYYLTDGTTTIQVYNSLFAFDALEDGETYNITGIYQQYNNTKEILPRSAADIEIERVYTLTINGYQSDENEGGYYLIASPVTVDLTNHAMTTGEYDLYSFDQAEDDEWRNYKQEAFNLEPGKGYLYAHKTGGEFTLTGTAYNGDPIVLKKTDGGDFPGWNLVGNPYTETAYIDRDFYVMNSQNGGEIITGKGNEIAVMQGFFVIADQDGEELEISTTAPNTTGEKVIMNVTSNRGNVIDRAIVRFGEGRQLPKFQLRENSTKISIAKDNSEYAVVRSEAEGEMPVSFKAGNNGTYTFSVNTENVEMEYLHLIDNMTGADIDLIANPSYSFEAKVTDYASRFRLVFSANSSINEQNANNFAFFNGNDWTINNEGEATLQVVDMTGRVLSTETINGNATTKVNAATGVYMLRLINGNNIKTQKVVVK